jgi:hypothetical protein
MLTRLAHLLTVEVVGLTATREVAGLVVEGREDTRLLLVHFHLRHTGYIYYP